MSGISSTLRIAYSARQPGGQLARFIVVDCLVYCLPDCPRNAIEDFAATIAEAAKNGSDG